MELFYIQIASSIVLGFLIGFERQKKRKDLGLKTIITISITSCALTITSVEAAHVYSDPNTIVMDPSRIPSYIISGIGFLGAGAILHKKDDVVSGLTTAALVWSSAGIGVVVGMGFIKEAFIAVFGILLSMKLIPMVLTFLGFDFLEERKINMVIIVKEEASITKILKELKKDKVDPHHVQIKDQKKERGKSVEVLAFVHQDRFITDVYEKSKVIEGIESLDIRGH